MSLPDGPESPGAASHSAPPGAAESVAAGAAPAETAAAGAAPADAAPSDLSTSDPEPVEAPADPERGLRGVMSAILIFEAIAILLGLTVIANGGTSAPGWQIGVIVAVALAHLLTPAVIRRPFAVALIFVLQAVLIGCWAIDAAIGITGIVFLVVWLLILLMRREFRRRLANGSAAGTMA